MRPEATQNWRVCTQDPWHDSSWWKRKYSAIRNHLMTDADHVPCTFVAGGISRITGLDGGVPPAARAPAAAERTLTVTGQCAQAGFGSYAGPGSTQNSLPSGSVMTVWPG